MCLYVNVNAVPAVSVEDITVYKIMRQNEDGSLVTPFREHRYALGETAKTTLQKTPSYGNFRNYTPNPQNVTNGHNMTELVPNEARKIGDSNYVEVGEIHLGIHSLVNLEDAKTVRADSPNNDEVIVIVECTIPAGSNLYSGNWLYVNFNDIYAYSNYASDTLVINRILE